MRVCQAPSGKGKCRKEEEGGVDSTFSPFFSVFFCVMTLVMHKNVSRGAGIIFAAWFFALKTCCRVFGLDMRNQSPAVCVAPGAQRTICTVSLARKLFGEHDHIDSFFFCIRVKCLLW